MNDIKYITLFFGLFFIVGFSIFFSCKKEDPFVNTPPVIKNQQFSIKDDSPNGTIVDTAVASDIDKNQTLKYAIISGNLNNAFSIDSLTGIIRVNNSPALKYEKNSAFELAVVVSDSYINKLSASAKIAITIIDAFKNNKPVITNQSFSIDENKPNASIVGTVIATDPDTNQKLKFSILSGNLENAFRIDSLTGVIKVNNSSTLDYEKIRSLDLSIEVSDNYEDKLSATAKITINLRDIFENRPPIINNQNFSVDENKSNGAYLGTVLASDNDLGQTLTFSIISGNINNAFGIEVSTGKLNVNNTNALNYEAIQSFSLQVKVSDSYSASLSDTAIITVKVQDVEEITIPQNGLVAYYPFNGNANDESGNSHNGTIYGASLSTDRHHKANSAYEFDGINDYINTFSTFDYQFRTVSFWVNPYDIHGTGADRDIALIQDSYLNAYGSIIVFFGDSNLSMNAGGTAVVDQYYHSNISENRWYHLALVRNGTQALLYINGDLVSTGISGAMGSISNPNPFLIFGSGRTTTINFFSGKIDEIAVYNRALSASEINTIYGVK